MNNKKIDMSIAFRKISSSPPPVLQVDWFRINDFRLRKGLSLRSLHKELAQNYNIFTKRSKINDLLMCRSTECRAVLFIAVCHILGLSTNDYIFKDNHTESDSAIFNKHSNKKRACPIQKGKLKSTTKKSDDNVVEFKGRSAFGSCAVKDRCVF